MSNHFDHLTSCLNEIIVWLDGWAKSVKQAHLEDDVESVKIFHPLCKRKHTAPIGHLPFMRYNMDSCEVNFYSKTENREHVSTSGAHSWPSSLDTNPQALLRTQCHDLYEHILKS